MRSAFGSLSQIVQDVHEIDVRVVRTVVRAEVLVDVAVRPVLGAHVIEVIAGGELAPILEDVFVTAGMGFLDRALELVELGGGIVLDRVSEPCREIAFGVGPRPELGDRVLIHRLIRVDHLRWREKVVVTGLAIEDLLGQCIEKLEDPGIRPLMLTECLVIHEEVAELTVSVDLIHPSRELLGGEWPFLPVSIGESKGDVVGQAIILQKNSNRITIVGCCGRTTGRAVGIVRRPADEQVVESLADDGTMSTHFSDGPRDGIVVDQFGVAKDRRSNSEEPFDAGFLQGDLFLELIRCEDVTQGMMRGLGEKLNRSRLGALLEQLDDLGGPGFELFECDPGDRIGHSEAALMSSDEIQNLGRGGNIALVGDLATDLLVRFVVEVERMIFEHRVLLDAVRLMNLKIEAYAGHSERITPFADSSIPEGRNVDLNS